MFPSLPPCCQQTCKNAINDLSTGLNNHQLRQSYDQSAYEVAPQCEPEQFSDTYGCSASQWRSSAFEDSDTAADLPYVQDQPDYPPTHSNCSPHLDDCEPYCGQASECSLGQEEPECPCDYEEAKPEQEPSAIDSPFQGDGAIPECMTWEYIAAVKPSEQLEANLFDQALIELLQMRPQESECVAGYAARCSETCDKLPSVCNPYKNIAFLAQIPHDTRQQVTAGLTVEHLAAEPLMQLVNRVLDNCNTLSIFDLVRSSSLHKEPKQESGTVQDCGAQDDGAPVISPQPYDAANSATAEDITADAAEAPAATLPDATSDEALSSALVCFKPVVALPHASNHPAMIPRAAPAQTADESQSAVNMQTVEEITPLTISYASQPVATTAVIYQDALCVITTAADECFILLEAQIFHSVSCMLATAWSSNDLYTAADGGVQVHSPQSAGYVLIDFSLAASLAIASAGDPSAASSGIDMELQQPFFDLILASGAVIDPFASSSEFAPILQPVATLAAEKHLMAPALILSVTYTGTDKPTILMCPSSYLAVAMAYPSAHATTMCDKAAGALLMIRIPGSLRPFQIIADELPQPTDKPPPLQLVDEPAQGVPALLTTLPEDGAPSCHAGSASMHAASMLYGLTLFRVSTRSPQPSIAATVLFGRIDTAVYVRYADDLSLHQSAQSAYLPGMTTIFQLNYIYLQTLNRVIAYPHGFLKLYH